MSREASINLGHLWRRLGVRSPAGLRLSDDAGLGLSLGSMADFMPPLVGVRAVCVMNLFATTPTDAFFEMTSNARGGTLLTGWGQSFTLALFSELFPTFSISTVPTVGGTRADVEVYPIGTRQLGPPQNTCETILINAGDPAPFPVEAPTDGGSQFQTELNWYIPPGFIVRWRYTGTVIVGVTFTWMEFLSPPNQPRLADPVSA